MNTTAGTAPAGQTAQSIAEAEQKRLSLFSTMVRSEIRAALLNHEIYMRDTGAINLTRAEMRSQSDWFTAQATEAAHALLQNLDEHY